MKKFWSTFTLIVFSGVLFFTSCGSSQEEEKGVQEEETQAFSTNFEWTPDSAEGYLLEDSAFDIALADVFYFGSFPGFDKYTNTYVAARKEKVDELVGTMDEAMEYVASLEIQMKDLRSVYDWYLLTLTAEQPDLENTLLPLVDEGTEWAILNRSKLTYLETLGEHATTLEVGPEWGVVQFQRFATLFDLTESYQKEFESLQSRLLGLYRVIEQQENMGLLSMNKTLDSYMSEISVKMTELFGKFNYTLAGVYEGRHMLLTSDIFFARDVVTYIDEQLPLLEKELASYTGNIEQVTTGVVELMEAMIAEAKEQKAVIEGYLAQISEADLYTPSGEQAMIPMAYAGFWDTMSALKDSVKSAAGSSVDFVKEGASMTWNATKKTATFIKDTTLSGAKLTGQVVGGVLEVADKTVKTGMDVGMGIYYGNKPSEIWDEVKGNAKTMVKNLKDGRGGAKVFSTAKEYMEVMEEGMGAAGENLVSSMIGEGYTSKTVGFIAKTTTGFFTGTAKDIYDTLNPDSTDQDRAMGILGLGMTAVGGSGSAVKPSDVVKNGGSATGNMLSKLWNGIKNVDPKATKEGMKNFFKGGFKETMGNIFSKKTGGKILETMGEVGSKSWTNMKTGIGNGYDYIKSNLVENVPAKFKGLFDKKNLAEVFDDALGTVGDNAADWAIGYFDNVIGAAADDQLKNIIKGNLGTLGISGGSDEKKQVVKEIVKEVKENNPASVKEEKESTEEKNEQEKPTEEKEVVTETNTDTAASNNETSSEPKGDTVVDIGKETVVDTDESDIYSTTETTEGSTESTDASATTTVTTTPATEGGATWAGTYKSTGSFSFSEYGITISGSGPVTFTVNEDASVTCSFTFSETISGSYEGTAVSGTASGNSTSCSGTVTEDGAISLSGGVTGFGTVTVEDYSSSGGDSSSFTMTGQLSKDGTASGSMSSDGYVIGFK